MEFRLNTLEELSPQELARLAIPGFRVCRTQAERDRFAKALQDVTRNQIDAAIYLDDLWGEFDYLEVSNYISCVITKHLHGHDAIDFSE